MNYIFTIYEQIAGTYFR